MCYAEGTQDSTLICALANKAGGYYGDYCFCPSAFSGNADNCHFELETFQGRVLPMKVVRKGERLFMVNLDAGIVFYRQRWRRPRDLDLSRGTCHCGPSPPITPRAALATLRHFLCIVIEWLTIEAILERQH